MKLTDSFLLRFPGRGVHQSSERRVRLYARSRDGRRRRDERDGIAGKSADLSLLVLLLHGQRNQLSIEAILGRRVQRQVLGSVSSFARSKLRKPASSSVNPFQLSHDCQQNEFEHAAH